GGGAPQRRARSPVPGARPPWGCELSRLKGSPMRFGICVMADIDAESLGYDSVWVTDSQMIFSDCYAVLALAARQTRRIRLGPGTAICGTRIPAVHVAAMATLNRLAPGRVHIGVGTGNTAMRSMGQR